MMMMTTTMMMTMNDGDDDGGMVGPGRMSLSHEEVFKMPPHDADSHLLQRGMEPRDGSCRSLKWSDSLVWSHLVFVSPVILDTLRSKENFGRIWNGAR